MLFLDPTNDYAFRRIFGNEKKKNILLSFLNSILHLEGAQTIEDVTLLNTNQVPQIKGAKETLLDVRCKDQAGAEYIVEMQVLGHSHFDKRVLYYVSKAYSNQLDTGMQYHQLSPIIFLGILNFQFTEDSHYISTHTIHNVETREHIFKDFSFTLAELSKFKKQESELQTVEEKWLYFLKYAKQLSAIPSVIHEQAIKDAFKIVNKMNWSKEELVTYERRAIYVQDEIQRVRYGYEKGKIKGRAEGRAKGRAEKDREFARKLFEKGQSPAFIAEITGLSLSQLKAIQKNLSKKTKK